MQVIPVSICLQTQLNQAAFETAYFKSIQSRVAGVSERAGAKVGAALATVSGMYWQLEFQTRVICEIKNGPYICLVGQSHRVYPAS